MTTYTFAQTITDYTPPSLPIDTQPLSAGNTFPMGDNWFSQVAAVGNYGDGSGGYFAICFDFETTNAFLRHYNGTGGLINSGQVYDSYFHQPGVYSNYTSGTITLNTPYVVVQNASLVTLNMLATVPLGSFVEIAGASTNGWKVQLQTGQTIKYNGSSSSSGGSIASSAQYNSVKLVCVAANTTFSVVSSTGTLTLA